MKEFRMQQAARLLLVSDRKIIDIAMQVGFDHLSYFISVFKGYYRDDSFAISPKLS